MSEPLEHMSTGAKMAADAVSIGTLVAAIVQWLPAVAALLTVIWTAIRIYETPTVQGLLNRKEGNAE